MALFEKICKDIAETKAKIEEIKTEKEKEALNNSKSYFRDVINGLYQAEKCCDLGIAGKSIILDAYIITNRTAGMEYINQSLPTLDVFYSIKIPSEKEIEPRPSGRFSDIAKAHYFDSLGKLSDILPGKEFFIGGVKKSDALGEERIIPTYLYSETPLTEDQYKGFTHNIEHKLMFYLQDELERVQKQLEELEHEEIEKE